MKMAVELAGEDIMVGADHAVSVNGVGFEDNMGRCLNEAWGFCDRLPGGRVERADG